jgi:hypothetical protein
MASHQYEWEAEVVEPCSEEPADDLDIADEIDRIFNLH